MHHNTGAEISTADITETLEEELNLMQLNSTQWAHLATPEDIGTQLKIDKPELSQDIPGLQSSDDPWMTYLH